MENNKFNLFIEQSKFISPILNQAKLIAVEVDIARGAWHFKILLADVVEPEVIIPFIQTLQIYFHIPKIVNEVIVELEYETINSFEKYAKGYFNYAIINLTKQKASYTVLKNFEVKYLDQEFILIVDKDSSYIAGYLKDIIAIFKSFGLDANIKLEIKDELTPTSKMIKSSIEKQGQILAQKQQYSRQNVKEQSQRNFSKNRGAKAVRINEIPIDQYRLDKYKNEKGDTNFIIEGNISRLEIKKLTNTTLLSFVLGDENDAIYVKRFLRSPKDKLLAESLNEDDFIKVEGNAQFDTFQKDVVVFAKGIAYIGKNKKMLRLDKAKEKRVEFHIHTKMSNMDGVSNIADYVDQAIEWGHDAIAFTDHDGLYAYPEIHKATKNKKIKAIYGAELSFVDETSFMIASKSDKELALKNAKYIVFDIETTGLSATRDKIIEIGAVKIENGAIVKRYQTFINPEEPLSDFTTKLTSITDDMLKDAPNIAEELPRFLEFAKGGILVAHNALFDVGHIRENAKKCDLSFDDTLVIDTLNLARYFYNEKLKRFNLKAVAKLFKIKQEHHHRADDDAFVTANIWLAMLTDLLKLGIKQFKDINDHLDAKEAYKHVRPHHVTVLTKTQAGYKNMFKVISDALTTHFYKGPRTLKTNLEKYRQGLLIGSSCVNNNVFEAALNQGDDVLRKAISYYDYIEVQPPAAYKHLSEGLGTDARSIIEATLSKIVRFAKDQNKIVIASGDVHYLDKKDVLYREIYIRTPLVGGGIHDLSRYKEMPEQYFLTTEEMLNSMAFLGEDLAFEIVVKNTRHLNSLIEQIQPFTDQLYALSDDAFRDSLGIESIADEVNRLVYAKMKKNYGERPHEIIQKRVTRELKNIIENEFAPNYYISHLLVKKSLSDGYLVGSRGSVGSSLVATLLDITEVNPLRPHYRCENGDYTVFKFSDEEIISYGISSEQKEFQQYFDKVQCGYDLPTKKCPICGSKLIKDGHDIPFETFLGFDGDKVPDIDLNFSGDYQATAHQYVKELMGEDNTFRAGTIQTVAERNAFGYVKGYLEDKGLELRSAQVQRLASKIKGVKRSTGQHPGGIIVVPKSKTIFDVTPIQFPANDVKSEWKTTHFDYHSFEANLLKLDILGHDDPTMIKILMDYVYENPTEFDFNRAQDIPLDDPKVYRLFNGTKIIGVDPSEIMSDIASFAIPEFGTPFTRQMLNDTKPDTFAGLVKISGLSHGTDVWIKNGSSLVNGSSKFAKIPFNDIIACRDDIMVQLIERGITPKKAFEIMEFVRKGKPGKDKTKWLEYEQEMRINKVPEWYIWSASQIKYMFPKAHAVAYVMMAVRIAWFKIHKPLLFYSVFFSRRASHFDYETLIDGSNAIRNKIIAMNDEYRLTVKEEGQLMTLKVALEMTKRGFSFLPVDINESTATTFSMENDGLRFPFKSIDGLGEAAAYDIVKKREEEPFVYLEDIKKRTKINKTIFSKLDSYGAFKDLKAKNDVIDSGLFAL